MLLVECESEHVYAFFVGKGIELGRAGIACLVGFFLSAEVWSTDTYIEMLCFFEPGENVANMSVVWWLKAAVNNAVGNILRGIHTCEYSRLVEKVCLLWYSGAVRAGPHYERPRTQPEPCQSGLTYLFAKEAGFNRPRGFESRRLRLKVLVDT